MFGYKLIRESEYEAIRFSVREKSRQDRLMMDSFMEQSKAINLLLQRNPSLRGVHDECRQFVTRINHLKTWS